MKHIKLEGTIDKWRRFYGRVTYEGNNTLFCEESIHDLLTDYGFFDFSEDMTCEFKLNPDYNEDTIEWVPARCRYILSDEVD